MWDAQLREKPARKFGSTIQLEARREQTNCDGKACPTPLSAGSGKHDFIALSHDLSDQFYPAFALAVRDEKAKLSSSRALSSVVEHYLHTVGVAGSKPAARTILPS